MDARREDVLDVIVCRQTIKASFRPIVEGRDMDDNKIAFAATPDPLDFRLIKRRSYAKSEGYGDAAEE